MATSFHAMATSALTSLVPFLSTKVLKLFFSTGDSQSLGQAHAGEWAWDAHACTDTVCSKKPKSDLHPNLLADSLKSESKPISFLTLMRDTHALTALLPFDKYLFR